MAPGRPWDGQHRALTFASNKTNKTVTLLHIILRNIITIIIIVILTIIIITITTIIIHITMIMIITITIIIIIIVIIIAASRCDSHGGGALGTPGRPGHTLRDF